MYLNEKQTLVDEITQLKRKKRQADELISEKEMEFVPGRN